MYQTQCLTAVWRQITSTWPSNWISIIYICMCFRCYRPPDFHLTASISISLPCLQLAFSWHVTSTTAVSTYPISIMSEQHLSPLSFRFTYAIVWHLLNMQRLMNKHHLSLNTFLNSAQMFYGCPFYLINLLSDLRLAPVRPTRCGVFIKILQK